MCKVVSLREAISANPSGAFNLTPPFFSLVLSEILDFFHFASPFLYCCYVFDYCIRGIPLLNNIFRFRSL
jgi:hypothetical protein